MYVGNNPVNYVDPTGHSPQTNATCEGGCSGISSFGIGGPSSGDGTTGWDAQVENCKAWVAEANVQGMPSCDSSLGLLAYQTFGTMDYIQDKAPWTVDAAGFIIMASFFYDAFKATGLDIRDETGGVLGRQGLKFTITAGAHMEDPARRVPIPILEEAIQVGIKAPDPRGSSANMFYAQMYRNDQLYNLEVLYNEETNMVLHFEYTRDAVGPLPKIPK